MNLTYFKRFRMEVDLRKHPPRWPRLPDGYKLVPWSPELLEEHAIAKYHAFRGEVDATVFGCLGDRFGCHQLMGDIVCREGFLPGATWLAMYLGVPHKPEACGTIQGVRSTPRMGAVQNVGVTPFHRGRGIGAALVAASLVGFEQAGLGRVYLEVTANNSPAISLYQRLGFVRVKTLYKAVELALG